nr:hypothetical protein [Tanacetum cinerariifolium]
LAGRLMSRLGGIFRGVPDEQHLKMSGADEGTGTIPRVPDVPIYESKSEKESWSDNEEEDEDDDENDSKDTSNGNDDDDANDDENQEGSVYFKKENNMFWHTARDDTMFTSMRCIYRHE